MKKLVSIVAACCLVLLMVVLAAGADKGMTGWVTDEKCGVKGASADKEACSKKCIEAGAKTVFVTDKDHKVLAVDNPDALKDHIGQHVTVMGKVDKGALHVDSAKAVSE